MKFKSLHKPDSKGSNKRPGIGSPAVGSPAVGSPAVGPRRDNLTARKPGKAGAADLEGNSLSAAKPDKSKVTRH